MVRSAALIVALLVPSMATAAKLVIVSGRERPLAISYPTMARCEAAKRSIIAQHKAQNPGGWQTAPDGTRFISNPRDLSAYCLPD